MARGRGAPLRLPQQRALLAALLLREGRTATAGELIDAFWGEDPPSQAKATIRTYASRLRKILGQETLVSESGGYALGSGAARSTSRWRRIWRSRRRRRAPAGTGSRPAR